MKERINKLVDLAAQYQGLAVDLGVFSDDWFHFRGQLWTEDEIIIWKAKGSGLDTVTFGNIKICGDTITLPVNSTEEGLEEIYKDHKEYLDYLKTDGQSTLKQIVKLKKKKEIDRIKEKLKELES